MRRSTIVVAWLWVGLVLVSLGNIIYRVHVAPKPAEPWDAAEVAVVTAWFGYCLASGVGLLARQVWAWWLLLLGSAVLLAVVPYWVYMANFDPLWSIGPWPFWERYGLAGIVYLVTVVALAYDPPRRWRRAPALQPVE